VVQRDAVPRPEGTHSRHLGKDMERTLHLGVWQRWILLYDWTLASPGERSRSRRSCGPEVGIAQSALVDTTCEGLARRAWPEACVAGRRAPCVRPSSQCQGPARRVCRVFERLIECVGACVVCDGHEAPWGAGQLGGRPFVLVRIPRLCCVCEKFFWHPLPTCARIYLFT
jgi:hypothetical protein